MNLAFKKYLKDKSGAYNSVNEWKVIHEHTSMIDGWKCKRNYIL